MPTTVTRATWRGRDRSRIRKVRDYCRQLLARSDVLAAKTPPIVLLSAPQRASVVAALNVCIFLLTETTTYVRP